MKLSQLAAKPQLIKLELADEDIVKQYGEPIEFYIYDRQSMDVFMKLASLDEKNFAQIAEIIKEVILDDTGKKVLSDESLLPMPVMMKVIQNVIEKLGNGVSQTSQT
jgi:hypothetical protein